MSRRHRVAAGYLILFHFSAVRVEMNPRLIAPIFAVSLVLAHGGIICAQQPGASVGPQSRVALIIGNASYPDDAAPLAHPIADARALADELWRDGFDIDLREDLTRDGMQWAIDQVKAKIAPGSTVLFFFSGYGVQVDQQTYLIPGDAQISTEDDVRRQGVAIDSVVAMLNVSGAGIKLVIIDAARSNPYERRFRASSAGLAPLKPTEDTLAIFSAAPGKLEFDADGTNSLFVGELLKEIRAPGSTAEQAFIQARSKVTALSNGEQAPWIFSSLREEFRLVPAAESSKPLPEMTSANGLVPATTQQSSPTAGHAALDSAATIGTPTPKADYQAGEVFRDCPDCPELVVVPAGGFDMGSLVFELEKPVHHVTIARPFAIGRREIRFQEWDLCAAADACKYRPDDRGWGRDNRPVTDVSWDDAKIYVAWLSSWTGEKYRLPSEAEWEYAARAGTTSTFWWGDDVGIDHANCRTCASAFVRRTSPTGQYAANGFGLFDTSGNAAEWVEDCWNDSYRGAPRDGSSWVTGQCNYRVLRGGSFDTDARYIRPSARFRYEADVRYFANGFRIVRDLQ